VRTKIEHLVHILGVPSYIQSLRVACGGVTKSVSSINSSDELLPDISETSVVQPPDADVDAVPDAWQGDGTNAAVSRDGQNEEPRREKV
jgi:hypothetical protein